MKSSQGCSIFTGSFRPIRRRWLADDPDDNEEVRSDGYIFQVSLNRVASAALDRSIPAVKADAAHSLFKVSCKNIVWAVLDSGIDARHAAFAEKDKPDRSRVRKTFDFTRIREIVSNDEDDIAPAELEELAKAAGIEPADASGYLKEIADDAKAKRPINWGVVEKLITLKNPPQPSSPHGTHVAGIIGAYGNEMATIPTACVPTSGIYDFRVLGKTIDDTEFAVIAALQYIRYVNERHSYITIHGANLSLSIPHNVRNYACGRTPVCNECERLVESGVVVVAAAGNRGFQKFETDGWRRFRKLCRVQHHRSGKRRERHHGRVHARKLAAYLWRELLLQPRSDRRWPPQAGSGGARESGCSRASPAANTRNGGLNPAPAWRRRTSAEPPRCCWRATRN